MGILSVAPRSATWTRPPSTVLDRTNPLAESLVLLQDENGVDLVSLGVATITGTTVIAQPFPINGLTRGYGTLGVGSTDRLNTPLYQTATHRTWVGWIFRNGSGGGSFGRIWSKNGASAEIEALFYGSHAGAVLGIKFFRDWSTTDGQWFFPYSAANQWDLVGLTYSATATTSDPVMYLNGLSQSLTEEAAPVGTVVTNDTTQYHVGNRTDNLRNWDGMLGPLMIWDRILSPNEMWDLFVNPWSLYWQPGRRVFFDVGAAAATAARARFLPILGAA